DTFTFDPNTDDLYQFTVGNQQMFLATKMGQTRFVTLSEVEITKEKYGQTLCNFMGMYDPYSTFDSRVGINSAGGWFYLTSYPTTDVVIFDRSSWASPSIEHVSFRFVISKGGQAEIHRSLSPSVHTTMSVETPKKIPLNTWVYIQGKQKGLLHTVGWKTADDESIASKDFERASVALRVIPMKSAFMHEVYTCDNYPLLDIDQIAPNAPTPQNIKPEVDLYPDSDTVAYITPRIFSNSPQPIRMRKFFYQPLMEMFALMNDYDALDKDMAQTVYISNLDTNLLIELINATNGNSKVFRFVNQVGKFGMIISENASVYADANDIPIVFDLRDVPAE
ncbi:MAG: hypothetical protein K2N12_04140, partial [Helicobacter sp.]|nr:hypothetical protein [Helicobacter sp.]